MVAALDPASQTPAASIVKRSQLSRDALAAVDCGTNLRGLLDDLLGRGLPADALTVVAQSLPKRYVVAWACDCLKTLMASDPKSGPKSNDMDRAGLSLAQQWLADPTEENRKAALDFAERGEFGSPGAWIAASAGWSGGSLLPRGYDVVAPPDTLPAEAAVAALRMAASRSPEYSNLINGFIARAIKLFGQG
ncbi:MAG TPA: hypothetical protein VGM84_28065 [Steroidobacteraceae bacterium]